MTTVDLSAAAATQGGSTALTGYFVQPTSDGPWPGVVLVHEVFGLDEAIRRHAEHVASLGYLALAPDLFSDGGTRRCLVSTMKSVSTGEGKAYADIEVARQWLRQLDGCTGKVGVIGFCMGGGFALVTASRGFDAAAPNYGPLPEDVDAAMAGACPIVASYGGLDKRLKGSAGKLDAALTRAGVAHDVKEYPDAGHAFLNDVPIGPRVLRPLMRVTHVGPEPAAAADAWQRIDSFFRTHLT